MGLPRVCCGNNYSEGTRYASQNSRLAGFVQQAVHDFQNKVRAQVGRQNLAVADRIIALTQNVLDCVDCE